MHALTSVHGPRDLLHQLRTLMPGVAGVVLASQDGRPLMHDVSCDARTLAAEGYANRRPDAPTAGTLVTSGASVYLVLFLPRAMSDQWALRPS